MAGFDRVDSVRADRAKERRCAKSKGFRSARLAHRAKADLDHRDAFMATTFKDKPSAHEAFAAIATVDLDIWYTKDIFADSHNWADAP